MSNESFSYVLLTAGIGMGLVFFFLAFLSLLMIVIRIVFDRVPQDNTKIVTGPSTGSAPDPPSWAIVAAVAYLMEEENDSIPQAKHWVEVR